MSDRPTFDIKQLRKSHGGAFALEIERLEIRSGERLTLLGPTGAGKSTLLRLLAGLEDSYQGEIKFEGQFRSPSGIPLDQARRLTLVHQRPLLLQRSVRQNVEFGLKLRGRRDDARVTDCLERCGLMPLARQRARTLSGGQMQLVALARALVIDPDVLLLDEPTAHLDPAHVALVEEVVGEFQQQRRSTVVWATHNLFQTRRVSDRVALLLGGRLVEVADCVSFFDHPADPRTAAFTQGKMVY